MGSALSRVPSVGRDGPGLGTKKRGKRRRPRLGLWPAGAQVNWLIPFLMLSGVQALAAPAPATPATTRSLSLVECIRLALEHNVATASIHHLALAPTANQSSKPSHRTFDRINRSNRILNERQVSSILLIVFILSKILKALPREEGSLPSKLCHPRNGRAVAACL